jgi:hypothetical protein
MLQITNGFFAIQANYLSILTTGTKVGAFVILTNFPTNIFFLAKPQDHGRK